MLLLWPLQEVDGRLSCLVVLDFLIRFFCVLESISIHAICGSKEGVSD